MRGAEAEGACGRWEGSRKHGTAWVRGERGRDFPFTSPKEVIRALCQFFVFGYFANSKISEGGYSILTGSICPYRLQTSCRIRMGTSKGLDQSRTFKKSIFCLLFYKILYSFSNPTPPLRVRYSNFWRLYSHFRLAMRAPVRRALRVAQRSRLGLASPPPLPPLLPRPARSCRGPKYFGSPRVLGRFGEATAFSHTQLQTAIRL